MFGVYDTISASIFSLTQSMMLTGYSLTLYMVPTILCFIPSLYWHLIMLIIAALLRTIFLLRNYSTRIESKAYLFLVVILLIEGLYLYIMLQTMFKNNSGYTIDDGTKQVFSHQMALRKFKE